MLIWEVFTRSVSILFKLWNSGQYDVDRWNFTHSNFFESLIEKIKYKKWFWLYNR